MVIPLYKHKGDGKWYFWNETYTSFAGGPYDTQDEALVAWKKYCDELG